MMADCISQRRLVEFRENDLTLVEDLVQPVKIGRDFTLYSLREAVPLFGGAPKEPADTPALLLASLGSLFMIAGSRNRSN